MVCHLSTSSSLFCSRLFSIEVDKVSYFVELVISVWRSLLTRLMNRSSGIRTRLMKHSVGNMVMSWLSLSLFSVWSGCLDNALAAASFDPGTC